jgi:hypothetical protein
MVFEEKNASTLIQRLAGHYSDMDNGNHKDAKRGRSASGFILSVGRL